MDMMCLSFCCHILVKVGANICHKEVAFYTLLYMINYKYDYEEKEKNQL